MLKATNKVLPEQAGKDFCYTDTSCPSNQKRRGNQNGTVLYHSDSHGAWQSDRFRSSPLARIEFIGFIQLFCRIFYGGVC